MTDFEKKWEEFCRGEIKFNWSSYGKELVKDFVESERKDLIEKTNKRWEHRIKTRIGQRKGWIKRFNDDKESVLFYKHGMWTLSDLLEDKHED